MKGTRAKRNFCRGSCVSTGAKFPVAPVESAPMGDSDVISMPAGFCRHLVGKTLINVFHCDIAEMCIIGKLVIIQTFT